VKSNVSLCADLMMLADEYCEENLERDCIRIIKIKITTSNILFIKKMAMRYNKKVTGAISFFFSSSIISFPKYIQSKMIRFIYVIPLRIYFFFTFSFLRIFFILISLRSRIFFYWILLVFHTNLQDRESNLWDSCFL